MLIHFYLSLLPNNKSNMECGRSQKHHFLAVKGLKELSIIIVTKLYNATNFDSTSTTDDLDGQSVTYDNSVSHTSRDQCNRLQVKLKIIGPDATICLYG